mmetsp:Transcript_34225/g.65912  ORF Transcript_34225/g.65912 Transcript_34225/m.65912 type:complete len:237 (-) Transcript_34225:390-1100(-)
MLPTRPSRRAPLHLHLASVHVKRRRVSSPGHGAASKHGEVKSSALRCVRERKRSGREIKLSLARDQVDCFFPPNMLRSSGFTRIPLSIILSTSASTRTLISSSFLSSSAISAFSCSRMSGRSSSSALPLLPSPLPPLPPLGLPQLALPPLPAATRVLLFLHSVVGGSEPSGCERSAVERHPFSVVCLESACGGLDAADFFVAEAFFVVEGLSASELADSASAGGLTPSPYFSISWE